MKFSERIGITPAETALQVQGMNDALRNSLWNVLDMYIWSMDSFLYSSHGNQPGIDSFSRLLWYFHFKKPMDSRPSKPREILGAIRTYYFKYQWYEVYNFLEHVLIFEHDKNLIDAVNGVLEQELAGYRFIKSAFVPITDEVEVEAIQKALTEGPFSGVHAHIRMAMEHLSRHENPDYRNSIKESVSAVESMARVVTGNEKATLGDAIALLEKSGRLHHALKKGFSAFYGYSSDQGGIRHAMLDEPNLTVTDAKFFLVSCSAFINYLKSKIP